MKTGKSVRPSEYVPFSYYVQGWPGYEEGSVCQNTT